RGFYEEEDINLTIQEGRGSAVAAQVVASGDVDFGMSDAGSLMLAVAKGLPIEAVMSLLNTSGFGVISLAKTGIESAKDLEGKTLAVSPGDALTQLFPAVIAANGLDESRIDLVFMDPPAKPVAVMEGRADALLGGIDDQFFLIEAQGHEASALRFADLGVNTVGITVHTRESTIAERPDLVERFVRASVRSWEAAREDSEAAIDAALKVKPDLDRESTLKQLEVDLDLLFSPNTESQGIGYGAAEDWEHTKELLIQYRDLETDREATSFYTNDFLPR
ncbi:MAG TPA: ABC transporter substrate-binding protein, partial [Geminicoccaceae bacterium]|nr:ABC transporter substrate-binding protein [Geminicoccaceae bacterium]